MITIFCAGEWRPAGRPPSVGSLRGGREYAGSWRTDETLAAAYSICTHTSPMYGRLPGQELFSARVATYSLTLEDGAEARPDKLGTQPDPEQPNRVRVCREAREHLHRRLHARATELGVSSGLSSRCVSQSGQATKGVAPHQSGRGVGADDLRILTAAPGSLELIRRDHSARLELQRVRRQLTQFNFVPVGVFDEA